MVGPVSSLGSYYTAIEKDRLALFEGEKGNLERWASIRQMHQRRTIRKIKIIIWQVLYVPHPIVVKSVKILFLLNRGNTKQIAYS